MIYLFRIGLATTVLVITWLALAQDPYPDVEFLLFDKLNHVVAFLVLAFLADYAFPLVQNHNIKWLALLGYGLFLEVAQYSTGYRYFEVLDLLADASGIAVYVAIRSFMGSLMPDWVEVPMKTHSIEEVESK